MITGGGGGAALVNSRQWLDADAAAFGRVAEAAREHEKIWVHVNEVLTSTMSDTEASMGWKTVSSGDAESNAMRNHGVGDDAVTSHRQVAASAEFFQQLLRQKQPRIDSLLSEHQKMQEQAHDQFADVQTAQGLLDEARRKSPGGDHSAQQKTLDLESAQLRDVNHRLDAIEEELEGHGRELDREAARFADTVSARNRVMGSYTDPHDDTVVPLGAIFGGGSVRRFGAAGLVPDSKVLSAMARYQACDLEGEARLVVVRDIVWFLTPSQQEAFAAACPAWSAEVAQLKSLDQAMAMNHDPNSAEGKFFGQLKASGVDFDVNDSAGVPSQIRTVRAAWDSLSAQEKAYMAVAYPGIVGNLRGVPPQSRYRANRVAIAGALEIEKRVQKMLPAARDAAQVDYEQLPAFMATDPLLRRTGVAAHDRFRKHYRHKPKPEERLTAEEERELHLARYPLDGIAEDSERRQGIYQAMLNERFVENPGGRQRQFLAFDPADDGQVIEVIGTLGRSTQNVGTFVPGTGSDLEGHRSYVDSGRYFIKDHDTKENAQVVFLNGDFPNHLFAAPRRHYARETGRELTAHQVEMRMLTDDARLTTVGHSYGGAIVGKADQYGAPVDNVVHLSSAGTGHQEQEPRSASVLMGGRSMKYITRYVRDPYPAEDVLGETKRNTVRYSDTPPGDAIRASQGFDEYGTGHGNDPDLECNMRVLPEGEYLPGYVDEDMVGKPVAKEHWHHLGAEVHTKSHSPYTSNARRIGEISFGHVTPQFRQRHICSIATDSPSVSDR